VEVSLRFYCEYCLASFAQFKDLVNHYEEYHRPRGVIVATDEADKEFLETTTDAVGYAGADSGCEAATNYLGRPSSCLKCPFPKCVLEKRGVGIVRAKKFTRNDRIRELAAGGKTVKELAAFFNVGMRTIKRAVEKRGGHR